MGKCRVFVATDRTKTFHLELWICLSDRRKKLLYEASFALFVFGLGTRTSPGLANAKTSK